MNAYKFKDLYTGFNEKFSVAITEEMMDKFLAISQDDNPLHTDIEFAKNKGFKDKVAYGMLVACFYSRLVGVYLPGKYCLLQGIEISFNNPVFVGDLLSVSGEISYINQAYKQIEIKARIVNQENKKVSTAKIKVGINE
ncbi:MAG: dehydratase [Candidatus Omnitrophica bacterium]|nr:dehydratase [Candidatus Omnitrophota bacterium]